MIGKSEAKAVDTRIDIVIPVYNAGDGAIKAAFGAPTTGFDVSSAPFVLVWPADNDYNAQRVDEMMAKGLESSVGFTYSVELWVKAHRLDWPIEEVPFAW